MFDNPLELQPVVPLSVISIKYRKEGHFEVDPNVFELMDSWFNPLNVVVVFLIPLWAAVFNTGQAGSQHKAA